MSPERMRARKGNIILDHSGLPSHEGPETRYREKPGTLSLLQDFQAPPHRREQGGELLVQVT